VCGISGIIGRIDERNRAALQRMNDAIPRGSTSMATARAAPPPGVLGRSMVHAPAEPSRQCGAHVIQSFGSRSRLLKSESEQVSTEVSPVIEPLVFEQVQSFLRT
jgi:hypothetical protein